MGSDEVWEADGSHPSSSLHAALAVEIERRLKRAVDVEQHVDGPPSPKHWRRATTPASKATASATNRD